MSRSSRFPSYHIHLSYHSWRRSLNRCFRSWRHCCHNWLVQQPLLRDVHEYEMPNGEPVLHGQRHWNRNRQMNHKQRRMNRSSRRRPNRTNHRRRSQTNRNRLHSIHLSHIRHLIRSCHRNRKHGDQIQPVRAGQRRVQRRVLSYRLEFEAVSWVCTLLL